MKERRKSEGKGRRWVKEDVFGLTIFCSGWVKAKVSCVASDVCE